MAITIKLAAYMRQYSENQENVEVKGKTVQDCLDALVNKYPKVKEQLFDKNNILHPYVSVFTGGEIIYADRLDRSVEDGATITILYVIGGG